MVEPAFLSADAAAAFAGRRVLFTGGSGFVGTHVVRQALAAGVEAHLLGRRPGPEGSVHHAADLCDRERVQAIVKTVSPAAVMHLAAPGVMFGSAGFEEMVRVAASGTEALLSACADLPEPPVVIHVGTGFEYAPSDSPIGEDHPLIPASSLYGVAKAVAATVAGGFASTLPIMLLRPFQIYGAGDTSNRLGPFLIRKALARERIELTALAQQRDFLHLDDCGRAFWAAATHARGQPGLTSLNVGSGEAIPLRRFVEEVASALETIGHRCDIRIGALPYRAGEPMVSLPDLGRLWRTLNWRPAISLRDGVMDLVRWSVAAWA